MSLCIITTREDRVLEFIDAAGGIEKLTFEAAWNSFQEECLELSEAAMKFHEIVASDFDIEVKAAARANLAKEWADAQHTLSQLALFYNIPGEDAFNRVADNNMTKVTDGKVLRREDGKIMKPDNYIKPDMSGL